MSKKFFNTLKQFGKGQQPKRGSSQSKKASSKGSKTRKEENYLFMERKDSNITLSSQQSSQYKGRQRDLESSLVEKS